jgi:hypothetical protein
MTQDNSSLRPIFRSIEVGKGVPITLSEPLSDAAKALVQQIAPQRFQLKPGTFGDAEQIDIQLGAGTAVQEMDFTYKAGTDYAEMVANFEWQLGPPSSQNGDRVTVWEDDSTVLRLVGSAAGVRSMLRNRASTAA